MAALQIVWFKRDLRIVDHQPLAADALGRLWAVHPPYCGLQMICFLAAALMTRRLDVVGFRNAVKTRFADVMEIAVD